MDITQEDGGERGIPPSKAGKRVDGRLPVGKPKTVAAQTGLEKTGRKHAEPCIY